MSICILYPSYTLDQLASSRESGVFDATLAAWSASFHPAILVKTRALPQLESAYQPPASAAARVLVLPAASEAMLTPEWCAQRESVGTKIVRAQETREKTAQAIIDAMIDAAAANEFCEYRDDVIAHFFAFGTVFFFIEQLLLPTHCAHLLSRDGIEKHLLSALDKCGLEESHSEDFLVDLRAAYELLIETRTTFCALPQAKFIDLTFLARGENAVNYEQLQNPLASGDDASLPMTLMPLLEIIESMRRGYEKFATCFPAQSPIFARLAHGISPLLPLLARLCGYRGVVHWIPQTGWKLTKKNNGAAQWRGVDGTTIPALMRYPIAAAAPNAARDCLQALASLSSPVLPLAICAHQESFWLDDLRRSAEFETFGKFYTLQQLFATSENSADTQQVAYSMAQYRSQFAESNKENIISDSLQRFAASARKIIAAQKSAFADGAIGYAEPTEAEEIRPVCNPLMALLRVWFGITEPSRYASAGGFGYAEPKPLAKPKPLAAEILHNDKKTFRLRNEFFAVQIDAHTGGIASLMSPQVRGNRLAVQLALRLSSAQRRADNRAKSDSHFGYTIAATEEIVICDVHTPQDSVCVKGKLLLPSGELAARFAQTFTIARGSKTLEAFTTIEPILFPEESLWENYYALRFAWKNPSLQTYAGIHSGLYLWKDFLDNDLIESPEMLELRWCGDRFWNAARRESLSLFFGGLPFYRRVPPRKLDAILIPRGEFFGEAARSFRWGIGVDLDAPMQQAINFAAQGSTPGLRFGITEPSSVILIDWKRDGEKVQCSLVETAGIETSVTWQLPQDITNLRRVNFFGKDFNSNFPETLVAEKNVLNVTLRPYELILIEFMWT